MREELLLVTAPTHPLARKRQVMPRDLSGSRSCASRPGPTPARRSRCSFSPSTSPRRSSPRPRTSRSSRRWCGSGWGSRSFRIRRSPGKCGTGHLFCARIAGQQLVRETGWVHLRLDRVPRAVQEMMKTFERIRSGLKLSPGVPARRAARPAPPARQPNQTIRQSYEYVGNTCTADVPVVYRSRPSRPQARSPARVFRNHSESSPASAPAILACLLLFHRPIRLELSTGTVD